MDARLNARYMQRQKVLHAVEPKTHAPICMMPDVNGQKAEDVGAVLDRPL